MRIEHHPILEFEKKEKVTFTFNGEPVEAYAGETVAAALHAAGYRELSHSPELGHPRGLFCAIGNCSSCFMTVDGVPNVRVCVLEAAEGMKVESQKGKGVAFVD